MRARPLTSMTARRDILARISVGRSRFSPFVAPTIVVLAGGALVAGTVTMLDSSVLSVQEQPQRSSQVPVQVWKPEQSGVSTTQLGSVISIGAVSSTIQAGGVRGPVRVVPSRTTRVSSTSTVGGAIGSSGTLGGSPSRNTTGSPIRPPDRPSARR